MRRYSRNKNSVRIFSAITLIAAVVLGASYYLNNKKEKGMVVAKVNGQEIYQSEIEQKLRNIFEGQGEEVAVPAIENLPKEVLDILIKETYLDKELSKLAKRSDLMKDKKVKERVAAAESKILRQSYIDSVLEKEVTEQKVSAKYAEISSNLAGKKEYSIFHIVAKSKEEAGKIYKEITAKKKSIRFSDAAKKYSIDQESAERGGDLGFVLEENMIKEIADAIVNLKQDEISAPIQTKFGWHLVKFTEVREAQPLPFDSVKQNLREQLEQDKTNEIEAKIVKDAKVKIVIKLKEAVEPKKAETAAEAAPAAIESVEIEPAAIDAESIAAEEPKEIKNDKKNKKQ
jgi:peptidyl-prolyl cis-trans isomerase C